MTVTSDPLKAQFAARRWRRSSASPIEAGLRVTAPRARRRGHPHRGRGPTRTASSTAGWRWATGEWKFDHELGAPARRQGHHRARPRSPRATERSSARPPAARSASARARSRSRSGQKNAAMLRGTRASASWWAPTRVPRSAASTRRCTSRWSAGRRGLDAGGGDPRGHARLGGRDRPRGRSWAASSPGSWPTSSSRAATPRVRSVRQIEGRVLSGGRQVASAGTATLDSRPTPWPEARSPTRTEYRSTDVGPRLPR